MMPSLGRPRIPLLHALKRLAAPFSAHGSGREEVELYAASAQVTPGSLNRFKSCAGITLLSPNEDDLSIKFEERLVDKGLELCSEHLLPAFVIRTVEASSEPVLDHLQKILRSLSTIEGNSSEAVQLLEKIAYAVSTAESRVKDGVKTVKEASGNDPEKPLPESVLSELIKKLREVNSGQYVELLKELEKLVATASIPIDLKKQLIVLKIELKQLPWLITAFITFLGGHTALEKPDPSKAKPSSLDIPIPLPVPVVPTASLPIPFTKFGKRALDVLYGGFVEDRLHAEVQCCFKLGTQMFPAKIGNPCYPSVLTKMKSAQQFSLLMKHKQLFGDQVKGAVSIILPFGTTSLAKVQYMNEKYTLSAEMGLHLTPSMKISGSYSFQGLCGGGAVTFGARDGRITGAEAGVSASNPEWGILSGQAKMSRDPETGDVNGRTVKILYSQDVQKNTVAADVAYNYEDNTMVVTAGVEHRVDDSMLLKTKYRTDGVVACMVQFKEGLAGSTFRAMVQMNVFSLSEQPRVGFSITTDPTK